MLIRIGGLDIEEADFPSDRLMVGATGFEPATSTPPV
jgi:hypothetical protein